MREQELEMLQREKEAEHFKTWEEQEDNFHLQQAKLRCGARSGGGGGCPLPPLFTKTLYHSLHPRKLMELVSAPGPLHLLFTLPRTRYSMAPPHPSGFCLLCSWGVLPKPLFGTSSVLRVHLLLVSSPHWAGCRETPEFTSSMCGTAQAEWERSGPGASLSVLLPSPAARRQSVCSSAVFTEKENEAPGGGVI